MKYKIGVFVSGNDKKVGSKFCAIVVAHPNFFRQNYFNGKELPKILYDKLEHAFVVKLLPSDMKDKSVDNARLIIDALNSYYRFWKHEIHVSESEDLKDVIDAVKPKMLKKVDIKLDKWHFNDNSRIVQLAKLLTDTYEDDENRYLKIVYGYNDEDSFIKNNPKNVYIRK